MKTHDQVNYNLMHARQQLARNTEQVVRQLRATADELQQQMDYVLEQPQCPSEGTHTEEDLAYLVAREVESFHANIRLDLINKYATQAQVAIAELAILDELQKASEANA